MKLTAVFILVGAVMFVAPLSAVASAATPATVAAKCDGATDDAHVFQAALDNADPAHGGSGVIVVPSSTRPCLIGTTLLPHSNETIEAGPGSAVLEPVAPAPAPPHNPLLLLAKGVSHVTLRGLAIDGRAKEIGTSSSLITVFSADHVLFSHIVVRNARGSAVTFSGGPHGVTDSGIENSTFDTIGTYYLVSGDKHADRKQSVVWCCGGKTDAGEYVNQHNFFRMNTLAQNGFDNLSVAQQSWFVVAGNHFAGSYNGANIYCSHNAHLRIAGNTTTGAAGNGVDCFVNDDLSIIGNQSSSNGAAGIQAAETHCGLIAHNTTMNNFRSSTSDWAESHAGSGKSVHQGGITIGGEKSNKIGTEDVTITQNTSGNNQAPPTQKYGIQVRQPATVHSLSVISDNKLVGNTGGPFGEQLKTERLAPAASCQIWTGHS